MSDFFRVEAQANLPVYADKHAACGNSRRLPFSPLAAKAISRKCGLLCEMSTPAERREARLRKISGYRNSASWRYPLHPFRSLLRGELGGGFIGELVHQGGDGGEEVGLFQMFHQ